MKSGRPALSAVPVIIALVLGVAAACNESPTGPTQPSPPLPAVMTGIRISPSLDEIPLGASRTLQATATYSDGRQQLVNASWRSDNPTALGIDANGVLATERLGAATITATFEEHSDARRIWVVPPAGSTWKGDFSGTWIGEYRVVECERISGPGPSVCRGNVGAIDPVRLELTQSHNAMSGTIVIYSNPATGTVSGWVDSTGLLVLDGEVFLEEGQERSRVYNWRSEIVAGRMQGSFAVMRRFTNAFGPQVVDFRRCDLLGLTRTSGSTAH